MTLTLRFFGRELFSIEMTPDPPELIYASTDDGDDLL